MTLGHKLDMLLSQRRMKAIDLAAQLELSPSTVTRWVRDEANPTMRLGLRLARYFDVSMEWLADDSQGYPPAAASAARVTVTAEGDLPAPHAAAPARRRDHVG